MSKKEIFRVVTRAKDGSLLIRDFHNAESINQSHSQIGVDDCSTDLDIRGMPVFRGLVGPFPEGRNVVRYESPEVFEALTKEWVTTKTKRKRRTKPQAPEAESVATIESRLDAAQQAIDEIA